MIAVREFTSAAECIAHANAVHRRFYAKPAQKKVALLPAPVAANQSERIVIPQWYLNSIASDPALKPLWKKTETYFDAHVKSYQWVQAEMGGMKVRGHIRRRCADLGVLFDLVISKRRTRRIVEVRQLLMWEVRQLFGISYPEIGRMFGGRDHSTCVWAIRRVEAKMQGTSLKKRRSA